MPTIAPVLEDEIILRRKATEQAQVIHEANELPIQESSKNNAAKPIVQRAPSNQFIKKIGDSHKPTVTTAKSGNKTTVAKNQGSQETIPRTRVAAKLTKKYIEPVLITPPDALIIKPTPTSSIPAQKTNIKKASSIPSSSAIIQAKIPIAKQETTASEPLPKTVYSSDNILKPVEQIPPVTQSNAESKPVNPTQLAAKTEIVQLFNRKFIEPVVTSTIPETIWSTEPVSVPAEPVIQAFDTNSSAYIPEEALGYQQYKTSDYLPCDSSVEEVSSSELHVTEPEATPNETTHLEIENIHPNETDTQIMSTIGLLAKSLERFESSKAEQLDILITQIINTVYELSQPLNDASKEEQQVDEVGEERLQRVVTEDELKSGITELLEAAEIVFTEAEIKHFINLLITYPSVEDIFIKYKQNIDEALNKGTRERKPNHLYLLSKISLDLKQFINIHEVIGRLTVSSLKVQELPTS